MVAVVWLYPGRQRKGAEDRADARLYKSEQVNIARVADGISADTVRAAVLRIEVLFDAWLTGKKLILIDQFDAPGQKVPARHRQHRLQKIRIQIAKRRSAAISAPYRACRPTAAEHRL